MSYANDGLNTSHDAPFMNDPRFLSAYARGIKAAGRDYGWHWRVHVALETARVCSRIRGDFVECGVNRGFVASAIMQYLGWNFQHSKHFWLFDTFAGVDPQTWTEAEISSGAKDRADENMKNGFYVHCVDEVAGNFDEWHRTSLVVGTVPETLSFIASEKIAFAHVDMNCAKPEAEAFQYLWPRLTFGGAILFDDYCYDGYAVQGEAIRKVADEFGVGVTALPTGQGIVWKGSTL